MVFTVSKPAQAALKELFLKLNNKAETAIVIVEGKRDKAALSRFLNAEFFVLNNNSKRSIYESAEHVSSHYEEAILLLDADKKGKELTKKMKSYLQQNGVKVTYGNSLLKLARCAHAENLSNLSLL